MPVAPPDVEIPRPAPAPQLLVELPSRPRVFVGNLRDLVFPRRLPALELNSSPGEFWPDVLVERRLPWTGFLQSGGYHVIAFVLLLGLTRLFAMQPRVVAKPAFDHSQVIYYDASEYLPPLDTRSAPAPLPRHADPELAPQPIISVPAEADNREQTIVAPPKVKLKRNVALPNIVAWSDTQQRPRLEIPTAPLTPAADLTRLAPRLVDSVVTPPPDDARLTPRRKSVEMQSSVVAPPPELRALNSAASFQGLQAAAIAPPPTVDSADRRRPGALNIGHTSVIAPAPQLPVAEQRAVRPRGLAIASGVSPQVVPPPPSASGASFGARGRVIALSLHPAVGAPPDPPVGSRRGTFATIPGGHTGASGSPGSASTAANGTNSGSGPGKKASNGLPAGLYVGNTQAKSLPVAGNSKSSANPDLLASNHPPRVTSAPTRSTQPESVSKLSEPERAVFGNRKFYSVTLNMPNLNSAGGSWVIRFAERQHETSDPSAPAADLSQPTPTRKVDPAYPIQLMRENVAGTVILYAVIHADGTVGDVRVIRSVDDRLDRFASEAIAQWRFEPATKNGAPVDVEATFQIPFRPAKVGSNF